MRKIWPLLVVSTFLFYTAAYYPLFFLRRAEIKHEIKKMMLVTNQFDTLSFSPSAFRSIRWIEKGKEFFKEGKMYDVASIIQQNDSLIQISVFEDIEESNLYQYLRYHTENACNNSLSLKLKLLTDVSYIIQNRSLLVFVTVREINFMLYKTYSSNPFEEVPSPPPRCII